MHLRAQQAAAHDQGDYYPWSWATAYAQVLGAGRPCALGMWPEQVLVKRDFGRVLYSVTKFYRGGRLSRPHGHASLFKICGHRTHRTPSERATPPPERTRTLAI